MQEQRDLFTGPRFAIPQRKRKIGRFSGMKALSYRQPTGTDIDAKSIDGFMKLTRALESAYFPFDVDKIWSNCFPVLHQGYAETSQNVTGLHLPRLTELKSTLEELKQLSGTLTCLTTSLKGKISSVEVMYESMALSHGMNTAPVEVLDRIFEMACFEDIRTAFNLSLVNKHFHDIAMRNPRLWNKISNYYNKASLGQLQVWLERSKDAGLNVELDFSDEPTITSGIKILSMVTPEAPRWESVSYRMGHPQWDDWLDMFRDISRYSYGLNLPRLKSATLRYPGTEHFHAYVWEGIINRSASTMHFYTTWYLPNLTSLTVINLIPQPFSRLAPPLTTLTLDIDESLNEDVALKRVYDMDQLLELLRSSPLLETICLCFKSFIPSTKDDDRTLSETILPNLQTFYFTAEHLTARSLLPFMKALHFPSLRNLHVSVDADTEITDLGEGVWLDCVLPHSYEQYMNVEVFSYKTWTSNMVVDSGYHFSYNVPFAKLHNLRSTTLETPCLKPNICRSCHDAQTCMRLPNLEDISFVRCDALDVAELVIFKEQLEKQGKWDTLKKITFKRCKSLSEGIVRFLFEGKDVIWEGQGEEDFYFRGLGMSSSFFGY